MPIELSNRSDRPWWRVRYAMEVEESRWVQYCVHGLRCGSGDVVCQRQLKSCRALGTGGWAEASYACRSEASI